MTVIADDVRPPRHHRRRVQPASRTRCATATTPGTSTPAWTTSSPRALAGGLGKRDLVSNINWFMNVPVEADGTLGIVDGISAPGLDGRRCGPRCDVLVLISNCPQINNPCNGFDPTPIRLRDHRAEAALAPSFDTVLVANRGEIACRIIRTLDRMGMRTVAVYSDVDRGALHVRLADDAVPIGPRTGPGSYLRRRRDARGGEGAPASTRVHPGYGFLSENAGIRRGRRGRRAGRSSARRPTRSAASAPRTNARARPRPPACRCPAGTSPFVDVEAAVAAAAASATRCMAQGAGGGGGIGMRRVHATRPSSPAAFERVPCGRRRRRSARRRCSSSGWSTPRPPRRGAGVRRRRAARVVALGERDCSPQRRNQKVIEETPAPGLAAAARAALRRRRARAARPERYRSAGTVEFVSTSTRASSTSSR